MIGGHILTCFAITHTHPLVPLSPFCLPITHATQPVNQVVVWDMIVRGEDQALISLQDVRAEYYLVDQGYGLRYWRWPRKEGGVVVGDCCMWLWGVV